MIKDDGNGKRANEKKKQRKKGFTLNDVKHI